MKGKTVWVTTTTRADDGRGEGAAVIVWADKDDADTHIAWFVEANWDADILGPFPELMGDAIDDFESGNAATDWVGMADEGFTFKIQQMEVQ
jgi:hypothetical protein